jgi:hypothetical protein
MSRPPPELDGTKVVFWSWAGESPFFIMPDGGAGIAIYGLAICQYAQCGSVYRFSCDSSWEVVNDSPYESVAYAMSSPSSQYQIELVKWLPYQP